MIHPQNLIMEKERFFNSKSYHPQFSYSWERNFQGVRKQFSADAFKMAVLIQDNETITREAGRIFQVEIDDLTFTKAQEDVSSQPAKVFRYTSDEILTAFREAIDVLGLDYTVHEVGKSGFNVRPQHKLRRVVISKAAGLDYFSLDGEVRHEMVHIVRQVNGEVAAIPKAKDYLPT